jgi:hypothetical protein
MVRAEFSAAIVSQKAGGEGIATQLHLRKNCGILLYSVERRGKRPPRRLDWSSTIRSL